MQHIFRVSEITRAVKDVIEGEFPFVWVRGQVSNLSRPASGHVYFSLKDEEALLNVVWFKGSQAGERLNGSERYDKLTGEVLTGEAGSAWLADGADVLCAGRLTVYPPRGAYQMVAELVRDMGLGRLYLEFEALKAKLNAQGLFDAGRKRPLPAHPGRVAVVTAPAGAAIRDFLRIASARGTGAEVRIYPALVQGEAAPAQIAGALDRAGADGWAEVVALIRGGGSLEDLWAFNTEDVARAIHRSAVPVICGVGHEVDTTIADLVADVRAATPSHAAQLVWVERPQLAQTVDEITTRLEKIFAAWVNAKSGKLVELGKAITWLSPQGRVTRLCERLADMTGRLLRAEQSFLHLAGVNFFGLGQRLGAFWPGFLAEREAGCENISTRLDMAWRRGQGRIESGLSLLDARLRGLDPQGPLTRGYALARKADGGFLRSVDEVRPGDALSILIGDGTVATRVTDTKRHKTDANQ